MSFSNGSSTPVVLNGTITVLPSLFFYQPKAFFYICCKDIILPSQVAIPISRAWYQMGSYMVGDIQHNFVTRLAFLCMKMISLMYLRCRYFCLGVIHIPCYGLYCLIVRAKNAILPELFPRAFLRPY